MTEARASAGSRRILARVLLGWAIVLGLCAVVEVGFRVFADAPEDAPLWIPTPQADGTEIWRRSPLHVRDADAFWRGRADVDEMYTGVRVRTNAFGMRSAAIEREKKPGTFRVLCLGESSTFGSKVEQERIYSSVLEKCLSERRDGTVYEVLNAGTPGYSVVQSYAYLRRRGLEFEPDAVVLYHGYNDFLSRGFVRQRVGDPAASTTAELTDLELYRSRERRLTRVKTWLIEHSRALGRMFQTRSDAPPESAPVVETLATGANPDARVPDRDRREVLDAIRALALEHSFRLIIVVPAYASFDAHRELLLSYASENGIACIDADAILRAHGKERARYFVDKVHPSPVLHRLIAEALCSELAPERR